MIIFGLTKLNFVKLYGSNKYKNIEIKLIRILILKEIIEIQAINFYLKVHLFNIAIEKFNSYKWNDIFIR